MDKLIKILKNILLCICLGTSLTACAPALLGGTVMGSVMASDRRTTGAQVEDKGIELKLTSLINENLGERAHVNVNSYNRQLLLTGEVPSAQDKQLVEKLVSRVTNVKSIVNEIAVFGNTTLVQRGSDSVVTGRVKAGMLDIKDMYINAFKVVTERGVVYLMGRVTQKEATRATELARSTSGVQKVVRLVEIISEEELKSLMKPLAEPGKK